MAWSKRKPYHHLKLSMKEFFSKPVRYLKEFYGKESLMDKPYRTDGRPEMHHDIPEYPGLEPWIRPRLPEIPVFGGFPPLPPIPRFRKFPPLPEIPDFPPFEFPEFRFEQPRIASPWVRPEESMGTPPRPRPGEPAIKPPMTYLWWPDCDISGYVDCLNVGDVGFFNAAGDRAGTWGVEVSDPDLVSAEIIKLNAEGLPKSGSFAEMIKIKVTGLAEPEVERFAKFVSVCVFMGIYKTIGSRSVPYPRGSGHDTTHKKKVPIKKFYAFSCGCIDIEVPCECGGDADPLIWETGDLTIAQGSAPCSGSGSTIGIEVSGGTKPYSWSVSGTGFCLDYSITTGLTNTLRADDTACGTAEITVTDKCGQTVTGYIRCTTGQWTLTGLSTACIASGDFTIALGACDGSHAGKITGKYLQCHYYGRNAFGYDSNCNSPDGYGDEICTGGDSVCATNYCAVCVVCVTSGGGCGGNSIWNSTNMCSLINECGSTGRYTNYETYVVTSNKIYEWTC